MATGIMNPTYTIRLTFKCIAFLCAVACLMTDQRANAQNSPAYVLQDNMASIILPGPESVLVDNVQQAGAQNSPAGVLRDNASAPQDKMSVNPIGSGRAFAEGARQANYQQTLPMRRQEILPRFRQENLPRIREALPRFREVLPRFRQETLPNRLGTLPSNPQEQLPNQVTPPIKPPVVNPDSGTPPSAPIVGPDRLHYQPNPANQPPSAGDCPDDPYSYDPGSQPMNNNLGDNLGDNLSMNRSQQCQQNRCQVGGCYFAAGGGCQQCVQYRWMLDFDLMFLNFHKENGIVVGGGGNNTPGQRYVDFDLKTGYRAAVRYALDNRYYVKVRGFQFKHGQAVVNDPNSYYGVDTFNIDAVFGRKRCYGNGTEVEVEAGARWLEFAEASNDTNARNQLNETWTKQLGFVCGGELRHRFVKGISAYVGGNLAFTQGDYYRSNQGQVTIVDGWDVNMYDFGFGVQFDHCLRNGSRLQFRTGGDFIKYDGIASDYNANTGMLGGWLDTEFAGFSMRLSLAR